MPEKRHFFELLRELRKKRMLVVLFLGFSSGLPIMIPYYTLKVWLRREGVELDTIGYIGWLAIPYTFNFLWAPLLDRFNLIPKLGRRRSWILFCQIGLAASMFGLGLGDVSVSVASIVIAGIGVSIFSATQDVAVDAYRREILPTKDLGVGSALGVYGYRVAMLITKGFALWVVDPDTWNFTFQESYQMLAAIMLLCTAFTFLADEPKAESTPKTLFDAVVKPFVEFFKRQGWNAFYILMFIVAYKLGDAIAGSMLGSYYVDIGFSNRRIAEIGTGVGFFSSMAGLAVGGIIIFRFGYIPTLWFAAIIQALSTISFAALEFIGPSELVLAPVVAFEDFSGGIGTTALVAFMGAITNVKFTATQYALFASLASSGRAFFSGFAGELVELTGKIRLPGVQVELESYYSSFFILCGLAAIPGMLLLLKAREWNIEDTKP